MSQAGREDRSLEQARALLLPDAQRAYDEGAAPVLLRGLEHPVACAIVAERAPAYITILYGMLLLRRGHELEPLHDDVEQVSARALAAVEPDRDEQAFARDVDQLVAWGCLERRAEPLKIRGYKDVRRERFRYRLTDDAVALLDWLEARLETRMQGRTTDGRDLMVDVLGYLKEVMRLVAQWHKGERGEDNARRALHLLTAFDERVHAITEELLAFRAGMLAFAARPYNLDALVGILAWLERYVAVYLGRIETLRAEIAARIDDLCQPRFRRALAEQHEALRRERAETPAAFRSSGALRDSGELLEAQRLFFAAHGSLVELCARIDDSARAVIRKMHRHLRELERRSARLADVRARIREVKARPGDEDDGRMTDFANALIASAHARFGGRHAHSNTRAAPPLPRRHSPPDVDRSKRPPLRPKKTPPEVVRELRARRLEDLRRWIDEAVLGGANEVRLADAGLATSDAPRRWLDVARAWHLDRGRDLLRLDLAIEPEAGEVRIGEGAMGLVAPDCTLRRGPATASRNGDGRRAP